jgi:hypothetical protein
MPALAINPAAFSPLLLCMVEQANRSLSRRDGNGRLRSAGGVFGSTNGAAMEVNFGSRDADENFAPACVFRLVSRLCSVTASGLFMRPSAARSSAFTAFRKLLCNERKKIFRTFRKCRASALGSMAHSLFS